MFYCVSLTIRMQKRNEREKKKRERGVKVNIFWSLQYKMRTHFQRIRTSDESDVCLLVVSKSFPTCSGLHSPSEHGRKQRERVKKRAEHKQNLLIYFVCKAFDSRDLLSVKAETDWELRTFAKNFRQTENGEWRRVERRSERASKEEPSKSEAESKQTMGQRHRLKSAVRRKLRNARRVFTPATNDPKTK